MLPTIGATVALALLGLVAVRRLVPAEVLREANDVTGNYLQTLGTIYAVLLAFVVFVVWQQFNDTREHVEREANELLDLVRVARGLPGEVHAPLIERARAYVETVLGREWDAMARYDDAGLEEGAQLLDGMWDALVAYEPLSQCHTALHDVALARFNDLSDARSYRLTSSRLRIPLALRLLLWWGAVIVIGSMYLFAVERFVLHACMTAALAGAISHLLYVIDDLDDCFGGDFQIPRTSFERLRRYLADPGPAEAGKGSS
jgi:hypothetical protein